MSRPRPGSALLVVLGVAWAAWGGGAPAGTLAGRSAPVAMASAPAATASAPVASASFGPAELEPPAAPARTACPAEMVLVDGDYCTEVEQVCRRWLDDVKLPYARCADYETDPRCTGERVPLRFCIDRREYTPPGQSLPLGDASLIVGARTCQSLGKRLCRESEWTFACEGEAMLPYPYGFSRAPLCNQDQTDLYEMERGHQVLRDLRRPAGADPRCASPFGVLDLVGNLDEPTLREGKGIAYPFRTALKGGWWMAARNRCRPATTAHDDHYEGVQVGVRCCRDAERN